MKISHMTRKTCYLNTCDCLVEVPAWAGLTVLYNYSKNEKQNV